jgi:hypothetical protein
VTGPLLCAKAKAGAANADERTRAEIRNFFMMTSKVKLGFRFI